MANFNFNQVILGGRLTADPELKTTPNGVSVCTFTMAVNRGYKDESGRFPSDFFTVTAWRGTAEFISRYFRKASSICVVGKIQSRSWEDKTTGQKRYAVEVIADDARFVDKKDEAPGFRPEGATEPVQKPPMQVYSTPGARGEFETVGDDEELPF